MDEAQEISATLPSDWFVIFQRGSSLPWLDRIVPGEFKHVMALGWMPDSGTWLWFNPTLSGLQAYVLVDGEKSWGLIAAQAKGAVVVRLPARLPTSEDPPRWPLGAWCVPLVANLVNVRSGAVTPTGLLRDCRAVPGAWVLSDEGFDACRRSAGEGAAGSG